MSLYSPACRRKSRQNSKSLLERLEEIERKLAATEAELARKDQIIDALQQRLFGARSPSGSTRPSCSCCLRRVALGKPAAPPEAGAGEGAPEEPAARKSARTRRRKADLFPQQPQGGGERNQVRPPENVASANPERLRRNRGGVSR